MIVLALLVLGASCATGEAAKKKLEKGTLNSPQKPIFGEKNPRAVEEPVLSPHPEALTTTAIVGATIMIGNGKRIQNGSLEFQGRKILAVGKKSDIKVPAKAKVIDGKGLFVTPGLIDTHSHLGVYATPHVKATADGNEMTDPTTPYVFSEHAFWL